MSCGPSFRTLFTVRETSYCARPAATVSDSWSSRASRSSACQVAAEPVVVAVGRQERRHAVVDLARSDVGVTGDDRERQPPLVRVALGLRRVGPGAHDAGHRQGTAGFVHEVGFLAVLAHDPLVVPLRRDDAAVRGEGPLEHAARRDRLDAGVDRLRALLLEVLRPARHEAPADLRQLPFAVPLADGVHGVGRGDVPARGEAGVHLAGVLVDVLGPGGELAHELGQQISRGVGDDEPSTHAPSVPATADSGARRGAPRARRFAQ